MAKLTEAEKDKLKYLEKSSNLLFKDMVKYQSLYTMTIRKSKFDKDLPKLANKGFKYEKLAFEANNKYNIYRKKLHEKYALKK
jgi:hypothetical protein